MQKFTAIPFIISAVASLALFACSSDNQDSNTQNSTQQPAASNYSLADQTAYNGAINLKDPSFCQQIKNAQLAKQCVSAVNDQKILEEAVSKSDGSVCTKISEQDIEQACEMQIKVLNEEQARQIQTQQQIAADAQLRDQIVQSKDVSNCKELTVYGHQLDCEVNILSTQAIAKKDKTVCSQATIPDAKLSCETIYDKTNS